MSRPPLIGVHLDLKYLMPSKRYLTRWVRRLGKRGVNTLLLEYEDKFPFRKREFLRDAQAFTPGELREFLDAARDAGLRIVPFVPTLSHLEFALAHQRLAPLRERPDIPTQICPSNPEAVGFVQELIEEILVFHAPDEWVHIGGDEAWFLGTCPACRARMEKSGPAGLWADHMRPLIRWLHAKGKRVMVCDDVFADKPDAVLAADLPSGLALTPWDYASRDFPEGCPMERRVGTYRRAGLEVVGMSCMNWGVLAPMHDHCVQNMAAWVRLSERADMLGVFHTAWACFHVPLAMQALQERAAGALVSDCAKPLTDAWQASVLSGEYGCDAAGAPEALRQLGTTWEQPVPGFGRPIAPVVHGYMDMVLHYSGGQEERRRRGHYPLDWDEMDFNVLYVRKMDILGTLPLIAVREKLDELEALYGEAECVLVDLARRARRSRQAARLTAGLAALKLESTRAVRRLVTGDGDTDRLAAMEALCPGLHGALRPFYEKPSLERLHRMWTEPPLASLRAVAGQGRPAVAGTGPCPEKSSEVRSATRKKEERR